VVSWDFSMPISACKPAWREIVDASIVPVPTQRNSRDENAELQAGRTPAGWKQKPAKVRQKGRDARWTKKHSRSFFGYKNHQSRSLGQCPRGDRYSRSEEP
jgi:hypothetical protein